MASVDIYTDLAADLAAAYYAATLRPDPTLDTDSDPQQITDYRATGERLATSLLAPKRRGLIRCHIPPPRGQRPKAIATIHDRYLLVVREHRGTNAYGMQLVRYLLVDLRMAAAEGHESVSHICHNTDRHDMPQRWLRSVDGFAASERSEPFAYNPAGGYVRPDGTEAPDDRHSARELAFALTTGHLNRGTVLVALPPIRAIYWRTRFGSDPTHEAHLDRLVSKGDFRGQYLNGPSISKLTPTDLDDAHNEIRRVEEAHR